MKPSRINTRIVHECNSQPAATVAMPVYNGDKIAWLALESLAKQQTHIKWELIICEEKHSRQCGVEYFKEYTDKLTSAGCVRVVYIELDYHVNLIDKWRIIGERISESSKVFLLKACDCYSFKERIQNSYDKIVLEGYDWYDINKGFFYSFQDDKMILYDYDGVTNLSMAFDSSYAKRIPRSDKKKGIDFLLFNTFKTGKAKPFKRFTDKTLYLDSIDTDGHNNISVNRVSFYTDLRTPFVGTTFTLGNLPIDEEIKRKINIVRFIE